MADSRGGYRKPANPAPVSGPGRMAKRTDGQPARYVPGLDYGEGQELMTQQQAAPMSSAPGVNSNPTEADLAMLAQPRAGLFDPPEEGRPLTQGQPFGEGARGGVVQTVHRHAGPGREPRFVQADNHPHQFGREMVGPGRVHG